MPLCEIRVPTYRRAAWLRRALESLCAQSHTHWRAVVLDDSPDREGEAVVRQLGDERITYRPNGERLGAARNLDQSFSPESLAGGDFACILEDDAALHPDYLRENIRELEAGGVDLLWRNQRIYEEGPDGWRDTGETTRGTWLAPGIHSPVDIYALLFFMEGISNGGLFWRLGRGIDLCVGPTVTDAGAQESCRTLLVREPLLFAAEPLVIYTRLPPHLVARTVLDKHVSARGKQALREYLFRTYGEAVIIAAEAIAQRKDRRTELARALIESDLHSPRLVRPALLRAIKAQAKGRLRKLLYANPVATFVHQLSPAAS